MCWAGRKEASHWWAEPDARGGAFALGGVAVLRESLNGWYLAFEGGEGAPGVVLQHAPPWAFCIVKNKYELCTVRGVEEKNLKTG